MISSPVATGMNDLRGGLTETPSPGVTDNRPRQNSQDLGENHPG
jgi:hypothetical protein